MTKLTRATPPVPPLSSASVTELRRWSRFLDRTPGEDTIIDHILFEGRDLRWTMYTGTNLAAEIACIHDKNLVVVKHAVAKLVKRGWLRRGTNDIGQRFVQLTPKFEAACVLANQRAQVRKALGPGTWWKINGNDKLADTLHALSLDMKQVRYKDRVKAAARAFIDGIGRGELPGWESHPVRVGIAPSQGVNSTLRLIDGERKSAP